MGVTGYCDTHYDLAVEVLRCRGLIKGYSDTHARGARMRPTGRAVCAMRRLRTKVAQHLTGYWRRSGLLPDGWLATVPR